jgi:diacylglycerol kinase (ATP)
MRKALLFYNPQSGRRRQHRIADVEAAAAVLRSVGVEVLTAPTRGRAGATEQVEQAIAQGYDTIFACGGDGTIHDLLQGLVGTGAALGIIPLCTANSLAHDLGIPGSPATAARAAIQATPRRISVGRVEYMTREGSRSSSYFTIAAGVGVDARLFYQLNPLLKGRLGMAAYYLRAWRLWMTDRMERFAAEFRETGASDLRSLVLTELLAVRIRHFGGILRELAPGADLKRDDLRLVLCKTGSRSLYLAYVVRGLLGTTWNVPRIELAYSHRVKCDFVRDGAPAQIPGARLYVEADGEWLGLLPAEISMVPRALTLLG